MKRLSLLLLLLSVTVLCWGQPAKPDTLKWSVKFDNTAIRNRILQMMDTTAIAVNNSDIPAKDRVKIVNYQQQIINFFSDQFNKQNIVADKPKEIPKEEKKK